MKRRSFMTIILAIIFLFAAISIGQARGPDRGKCYEPEWEKGKGRSQRGINACLADLDLSSAQIVRLRRIREEHMDNMDRIRQDMRTYRNQKRKLQDKWIDVDQKTLDKLLDQGSDLWKEREREQLRYRQQVLDLLTPGQKDKLYLCETVRPKQRWCRQQGRPFVPEIQDLP